MVGEPAIEIPLKDERETVLLGQQLADALGGSGVVFLTGTLGAGKTTLTRGVLNYFGHSAAVKSPTYTLVEPYVFAGKSVYHFDLYRLADPEELEYLGIRDYFEKENMCVVEWPCKGAGCLPIADVELSLSVLGTGRTASIVANTDHGRRATSCIASAM